MVCNEPLRPGQRLEPDCPGFSSNLSCELSSTTIIPRLYLTLLSIQRYSSHRTRLEPRTANYTPKARGASTSFLRRTVGSRPLVVRGERAAALPLPHQGIYGSNEPRTEQAESQGRFIAGVLPNRQGAIFMLRFRQE